MRNTVILEKNYFNVEKYLIESFNIDFLTLLEKSLENSSDP